MIFVPKIFLVNAGYCYLYPLLILSLSCRSFPLYLYYRSGLYSLILLSSIHLSITVFLFLFSLLLAISFYSLNIYLYILTLLFKNRKTGHKISWSLKKKKFNVDQEAGVEDHDAEPDGGDQRENHEAGGRPDQRHRTDQCIAGHKQRCIHEEVVFGLIFLPTNIKRKN